MIKLPDCDDTTHRKKMKRDCDEVIFLTVKRGIHKAIGNELCSLNDFIYNTPVIPFPTFILNFYRKNLIPLYMTATLMLIITAAVALGFSPNNTGTAPISRNSSTPMICLMYPNQMQTFLE